MDLIIYFNEMWHLALEGQKQGIFFWAALYVFIVCAFSLRFQIKTRYWPFTYGELVELGTKKFGATDLIKANQDYISKALYRFTVSDVTYQGSRISPWIIVASHNARFVLEKQMSAIERTSDARVKVFYNPKNPKKCFLIIAGKAGICLTLLICVLPIISYYINYHL